MSDFFPSDFTAASFSPPSEFGDDGPTAPLSSDYHPTSESDDDEHGSAFHDSEDGEDGEDGEGGEDDEVLPDDEDDHDIKLLEAALRADPDQRLDENGIPELDETAEPSTILLTPDTEIDSSDPVVLQFISNFTEICQFISKWCKRQGIKEFLALGDDQPLCISAFYLFRRADDAHLSRSLLPFVTAEAMELFGQEGLTLQDVLEGVLPSAKEVRDGGCYLEIATKPVSPKGTLDFPEWGTIELQGEQYEAGLYGGSSMDKLGVANRVTTHRRVANSRLSGIEGSKTGTTHYRFTGREGVHSRFALLARIPQTNPWARPISLAIEAIFQVYLNLVRTATTVKR